MSEPRKARSRTRREPPAAGPDVASRRRVRYALLLILALAAFLRLYEFTTYPPPLHFDEAMNGNDALQNLEAGRIDAFYPQNGGREGLFINVQTALIALFGNEAWVLRLPAAIFGILTVWAVYCLAAELFSKSIGLLASFFLATSLWHLTFSRIGLRAIASPLFLAWALYLLLGGLCAAREGRPFLARIAAAGVVYGMGFYTYIAYRATPPLILLALVYWWVLARREGWTARFARSAGLFAGAAAVTAIPLIAYFVRRPDMFLRRSMEISVWQTPRPLLELLRNIWKIAGMVFWKGDPDWLHNIAGRPEVFLPVALLFAVGLVEGIRAIVHRRQWFGPALAIGWLLLAAVPAVLSVENMPHALRALLMVPAIAILAAVGAVAVWERVQPRLPEPWPRFAAIGLLVILCAEPFYEYFYVWGPNPRVAEAFNSAGREIADRINSLPKGSPKYVMAVTPGAGLGVPAPTQTVMFLTRSYTATQQQDANIHYVIRSQGDPDGIEFCRKKSLELQGDAFCLVVNRTTLPGK